MHLDLTRNIKEIPIWLIFINTLSMKGDFFWISIFWYFQILCVYKYKQTANEWLGNKSNYTEESFLMLYVQGT